MTSLAATTPTPEDQLRDELASLSDETAYRLYTALYRQDPAPLELLLPLMPAALRHRDQQTAQNLEAGRAAYIAQQHGHTLADLEVRR